jgi:hypothetical protein
MEGTWSDRQAYEFSLGPFRDKMGEEEKKRYVLAETEILPSGEMRQVYVHRAPSDSPEPDEVVELFWKADGK